MRSVPRSIPTLVLVGVTLAACTDRPATEPTAPRAAQTPPRAVAALALTCDINVLKASARDYAASSRDDLFTIINDLQALLKKGTNPAATDKAFDGLARLAAMRGTSAQKAGTTGAVFNSATTGFIACMEPYIRNTVPDDFSVAGALTPGWMYEVRGKSGVDAAAGAYERGWGADAAYWAAEAPDGWTQSIDDQESEATRFLIYGYRRLDFLPLDPQIGSAFEIRTVPAIANNVLAFDSPLEIGLCNTDITTTARVQHIATILKKQDLTCAPAPIFAQLDGRAGSTVFALAQRAVGFFAPKPAHAAFFLGSVGGAVSELSPSVVIDMQSVTLEFVASVAGGRISRPLVDVNGDPLTVRVTTKNGSPLSGVVVTLAIAGNQSSIAFFKDGNAAESATVLRTTDANGIATFDSPAVRLTKAGGYQLVVSGSFDGVAGAPFLSNSFTMQNK